MTTSSSNRQERRTALRRAFGAPVLASALSAAVALCAAGPAAASTAPEASPSGANLAASHSHQIDAGTCWGDAQYDDLSTNPWTRQYDPQRDPGSLYSITTAIGARDAWHQKDPRGAAITGKGVTVAVLDSGVAPVAGLAGKVVQGPDLSIESNAPRRLSPDTYGHGTHMASIIGASDPVPTMPNGEPLAFDGRAQLGVAPGARLLALKLANTDGSTDVSQVIAGIDWVVEHRNDNGMNVRVINLSYGTESQQSYESDPLAAAVERAWQRGIVVVTSAGNDGKGSNGLNDPAYDPYVVAVGSTTPDTSSTGALLRNVSAAHHTWKSPSSSEFSSRGTDQRPVDVAAPGRSVTGLRAPGSSVDVDHPEGRVKNDSSSRLFRGSGTSQAAAVVSGAAALLLQADPTLTPDAVKAALTTTASPVAGADRRDVGSGQINVKAALEVVQKAKQGDWSSKAKISTPQRWATSSALGSLDAARGGVRLVDPETGEPLVGEVDVQNRQWDGAAWRAAASRDATWSGGTYLGVRYAGDTWASGVQWSGARWSGARWSGARWSGVDWDGARWSGARWSSSRYDGARWS